MMTDPLTILAALSFVMALGPAYLYVRNRSLFRTASEPLADIESKPISVLIPARNEASNIEACIASVIEAAEGIEVEINVLDDRSEDETARLVRQIASQDARVRLHAGSGPPEGWNGKQHACQRLADVATHETLLWIDADVRLEPRALSRSIAEQQRSGADLLSGFPRQITITPLERLLLPLIQFVLLGFLSLRRMRQSKNPAYAAGCGQFFLTNRDAYRQAGGHAAIRSSRHDGITLPRAYRRAGLKTDLFDATDLAVCRMYDSAAAVWLGLTKNATEGIATLALLPPVTFVLLVGQVLGPVLVALGLALGNPPALLLALGATLLSIGPRLDAAVRFRQPIAGALAHPIGIVLFLIIQWEALIREWVGKPVAWRGRGTADNNEKQVDITQIGAATVRE